MKWSQQQEAIFERAVNGRGNLGVFAYAGTGKSTTMREFARRAPERTILYSAFNTKTVEEMKPKFAGDPRVEVRTWHGVGAKFLRKFRPSAVFEDPKVNKGERAKMLARAACGSAAPDECVALVAKACTLGREMVPLTENWRDLVPIVLDFELEPPDRWIEDFGDAETVARMAHGAMVKALEPAILYDFTDMLYLPVRLGWARPTWQLVIIDEAQDLNAVQLILGKMVCAGRLVIVGDRHQAIYLFRGADSGSLDRLREAYDAEEMRLSTTYRCPKAVVREAQFFVPDYTAADSAPEGIVRSIDELVLCEEVGPGHAILSRKNADLVSIALKLIRAGKPAKVIGRDIAGMLVALLKELRKGRTGAATIPALLGRLNAWMDRQREHIEASEPDKDRAASKISAALDRAETLRVIAEDALKNISEVENRINTLFVATKQDGAVICSSVHKAKGLEWQRVYLLDWTFRHGKGGEEDNIRYVAITRAMNELVYVLR